MWWGRNRKRPTLFASELHQKFQCNVCPCKLCNFLPWLCTYLYIYFLMTDFYKHHWHSSNPRWHQTAPVLQIVGERHQITTASLEAPSDLEISTIRALLNPKTQGSIPYLPTELLREIFLQYADGHVQDSWGSAVMMPWRLGQISHRWREIVLSLPYLWDKLPNIQIGHSSLVRRFYAQTFTCLAQRSGTSPTNSQLVAFPWTRSSKLLDIPLSKRFIPRG